MTVHTENEALFQRASRCLAGGVLSNFKKAKGVAPVYVKSAEGCRMTDYDGNVYYDFSLSAGPAILGHSNEGLRRALREQLDQAYTNRDCLAAIEAAEKIQQVVPCAERSASPSPAWTQSSTPSGWPGLIQDAPCM